MQTPDQVEDHRGEAARPATNKAAMVNDVGGAGYPERATDSEPLRNGMQPCLPVEFHVLQRIEDIEPQEPEQHCHAQDQRGQLEPPGTAIQAPSGPERWQGRERHGTGK